MEQESDPARLFLNVWPGLPFPSSGMKSRSLGLKDLRTRGPSPSLLKVLGFPKGEIPLGVCFPLKDGAPQARAVWLEKVFKLSWVS